MKHKWKTTDRPNGPTGYKREGTFRDVSLSQATPEYIDQVDDVCMQLGINRSELLARMKNTLNHKPYAHLEDEVEYDPENITERLQTRFF